MWSIQRRRGAGANAMFVRVAGEIAESIRRGSLQPGDRIPSSRALAAQLGVNRNTVVAAYDELIAQGFLTARGAAGTVVSRELPERAVRRIPVTNAGLATRPGFEVRTVAVPFAPSGDGDDAYRLSRGVPDTRLLATAMLARAYRRVLASRTGRLGLDYGPPAGVERLRIAIAAMLRANRGIPCTAENILVVRGSQMGLDLSTRLLVRPGETVAVEELGYRPAWRAFEEAGATLAPIALDEHGLVVDALAGVRPRCVYVTPHHQYPTTVLMSQARRIALLERARRERFAILEDDYDHEFHFDGRPVAPLAASDAHGNVIYLGTLSKILAPGLRLGFVAASAKVIENLARLRATVDQHGDQVLEHAVAELLEEGEIQRHARKMRRVYAVRRDALVSAVRAQLGGVLSFELPAGGITLWARVARDVPLEAWLERARERGVAVTSARHYAVDGKPRPFIRIAYAKYDERELADAVRRLRDALPRGKTSTRLAT